MGQFLTFAMVAPMASFGAIAVGERRDGWDRPARSAVLGLVAACLGLTRDDEQAQAALASDYGVAILCHAPGRLLTDYHTTQAAPARRNWRPATRAEELAASPGDLATILSRRDYRTGTWHLGTLWPRRERARWTLQAMQAAMNEPVFTPSVGRRACPAGLPLAPCVTDGSAAAAVLLERHRNGPEARLHVRRGAFREQLAGPSRGENPLLVLDVGDVAEHGDGCTLLHREIRRDQPLSRTRWQFGLREEAVLAYGEGLTA
ncbi:type I-E CRISPR-associated protein Cas5/CasD [Gluconacetobacter azotocaptans]|uniref:Type I-E CRISPR-associated protein Cas5/CasD n=2 Tax=Gluconacetobacter azotocaptans TaxID=142834 RepID=A0A7W4JPR3_9PROT|nr:type I-E CRISPR-associated protein Cas5/CasD [Gluconacetobacter azotocaptans]MBB2188679.1 type I-E CRISPR-associated protein Cas5/CasD [Gluconacetobacter azotocaptans]